MKLSRLEGGLHIVSVAQRGLADLENLYTWLFGKFLPARKHELTRPYVLHRFIEAGAPGTDERPAPAIEVQVPVHAVDQAGARRLSGATTSRSPAPHLCEAFASIFGS